MQDAPGGSQHPPTVGYSLQEAAALLGIGVNTLRRRIAAGLVQAEQVERPQGYVWRVYPGGWHPPTPIAEAMVSLIQATIATVLGPLMAEQAALLQLVERQVDRVAVLERENGRQAAELERAASTVVALSKENDALRAAHSPTASNLTPAVPDLTTESLRARFRACAPWLLGSLALVVLVVLLGWPW